MDYIKAVDSVLESLNTYETDSNSRFPYLLVLFNRLKTVDFDMSDLDAKTTAHIVSKFQTPRINGHLDSLVETMIFMDVRLAAGLTLDKEKKKQTPKVEVKQVETPKPQQSAPVPEGEYDPDADVLEEEGLIEPPPPREMKLDIEFLKTLGMDK